MANDNGSQLKPLGGSAPEVAAGGAACPVPTKLIEIIGKLGHLLSTKPAPGADPTEVAADLLEILNRQNQQLRKAMEGQSDRLRQIPLLSDRKAALPVFYAVVSKMPDDNTDADGNVSFTKQACINVVNWLNESKM